MISGCRRYEPRSRGAANRAPRPTRLGYWRLAPANADLETPINATLRDVSQAVRRLRREPRFVVLTGLILAVGIGACTAMFSIVHAVLLRPMALPAADRVVMLWSTDVRHDAVIESTYETEADFRARLLELLDAEPRIGVLECSRRLGVARGTVQARLDKLIARGAIRGSARPGLIAATAADQRALQESGR